MKMKSESGAGRASRCTRPATRRAALRGLASCPREPVGELCHYVATTMTKSQFQFDGHSFAIKTAKLFAQLNDPVWCDKCNGGKGKELSWAIDVQAEDGEVDDEVIAPSAEIIDLAISPKNWMELSGIVSQWKTAIRPETNDRYGMTYVWDHSLISTCKVEIGERNGDSFAVTVVGDNEDQQHFRISANARFAGIHVYFSGADNAASVAERLAESEDISNLTPSPFQSTGAKYNAGHVVFTPGKAA